MKKSFSNPYDVIIIGGSYAGLSAAMALGRSLRKVLILDSGNPCNAQTPHSHNFITQDGKKPAEISGIALEQVLKYKTVEFIRQKAIEAKKTNSGFDIRTGSEEFSAKKIILATGIRDIFPDIRGLKECWGISAIHCPYCHGYEFRDQKTGIMARGDKALHIAGLVKNLTDDLMVFTNGESEFSEEQLNKLSKNNIPVIEDLVSEIIHHAGKLSGINLSDGKSFPVDALYTSLPFRQHSDIAGQLGCELTETGHLRADNFQKTNIYGVFACGDNASSMRSVANAVSAGNVAGAMANHQLVQEVF
ncbi:NAD(P)/FAD-dependent oxidoreductase [Chryseobacterium sp. JJR-5R]|uniref:NAD(P)/FAD-dependent oxidoreductase n=1 Tax=Chryseobacterium sp. JJR-5R TaxID=3093923 RepID=UPI002A7592AB|nr:NAD(P)/FAD-dependent oxidoreductase [Chryseobacterium sp. JJR-5R]WPO83774.1 NAD(P)/FAD-dependent oxidoreductase [Chryseobacterium sp. JJR-5R]